MELQEYLLKAKEGQSFGDMLPSSYEAINTAQLNKFIVSYLHLKEVIEDIFTNNTVELLTINLRLNYSNNDDGHWYTQAGVIQKGSDFEDYFEEEGYEEDYDEEFLSYEPISLRKEKINRPIVPTKDEEKILSKYDEQLSKACSHLTSVNKSWFGNIKEESLSIHLSGTELPDLDFWFLGTVPKALLSKAILDNELPEKSAVVVGNKYKI